jgi:hypothetical protein
VAGCSFLTALFITAQTFSIVLMSGLSTSQSGTTMCSLWKNSIVVRAVCGAALSCWKTTLKRSVNGMEFRNETRASFVRH